MRKLIVKLFNLLYLAGAVVAVVCFCTQPIFKTTVKVEMEGEKIAKLLDGIGGKVNGGSETPSRSYTFDGEGEGESEGSGSSHSFSDKLTPERIAKAFDAEGGFKFELTISLESKDVFNFRDNQSIIQKSIIRTIDNAIGSVIDSVTKPLNTLVKEIAIEFASETMQTEINSALEEYLKDGEEGVTYEQVEDLFTNVYNTLDTDEGVSVDDLANAILGSKDEEGKYSDGGIYDIIQNLDEEGKIELNGKTPEEVVNSENLTEVMTTALDAVPDLLYFEYTQVEITEEQFNEDAAKEEAKRQYYVLKGDKYVLLNEYDPAETYYLRTTMVNNVDTALAQLLSAFLNPDGDSSTPEGEGPLKTEEGEEEKGSRAIVRAEEKETKSTEEQLKEAVTELVYKMVPLNEISNAVSGVDQYAGWALLGLIGLFAFPWLLFGLVTLIRTLRKRKIWTKPWIVFFFAFLQVILGLVLTYGTKYAIPLVGDYAPQVKDFLANIKLDIRTGCLIPSFIYIVFIPLTIVYIILCHPLKVEYKLMKRARKGK